MYPMYILDRSKYIFHRINDRRSTLVLRIFISVFLVCRQRICCKIIVPYRAVIYYKLSRKGLLRSSLRSLSTEAFTAMVKLYDWNLPKGTHVKFIVQQ